MFTPGASREADEVRSKDSDVVVKRCFCVVTTLFPTYGSEL